MPVSTYLPDEVHVSWGPTEAEGYADGTFVTIEQNADDYELVTGADGEAARARQNNLSARMTVTLLATSPTNDLWSAQRNTDLLSGAGVLPFMCKDNSGRSIHLAESAWVARPPVASFSRGIETREWVFETDRMVSSFGGND